MSSKNGTSCSIGLLDVTFIVFLILKLTHVISWSWWWVCSPLIFEVGFVVLIVAIAAGIYAGS